MEIVSVQLSSNNILNQFRDAIRAAGLIPPDVIEADGKLRRFSSNGKRKDDAGWYLLHGDGIPAGTFGDWRTGFSQTWRADIGRTLTHEEEDAHRAKIEAMRLEREAEETKRKAEAKAKATEIWKAAQSAPANHSYLTRKGIQAHGAKLHDEKLVIPMRADGVIHSLQFIGPDGEKRFLAGGRVSGCYFSIGNPKGSAALCICEGFATGATIHEATSYPVAVAFNAGNLLSVAKAMREKFPELPLILCADDDSKTEGNPGLTKATEAARSVGGLLAIPDFGTDRPEKATDFNDMAALSGLDAVRRGIENTFPADSSVLSQNQQVFETWPEPQPLSSKVEAEQYPLDALPESIRAAVEEVQGFVKAPVPLVASSALAALSLAIQAHADVKRAERLAGPVGLFLLTIADSGERKSTCDGFFTKAIRDYEAQQAEAAKPLVKDYRAALEGWEARCSGIKDKIRQLAKAGKPTGELEQLMHELEHEKPEPPRVPRLLYGDATPEALAYSLAKVWPSGGVVSAEAGVVFGAHGMGKESAMRNLALLNILWDGGSLTIDRRSVESFVVRGTRLTVALQVQESALRDFFDRTGGLARGTGFLARFLVAWPESTQGFRMFTEAPDSWPHLDRFNQRVSTILNQLAPIDENGELIPAVLDLSPDAKFLWIAYHDSIESELASCGELYDVRDVASKSADNAARLAGLFQMFKGGDGPISAESFESASRIAAWHLHEARRFLGEFSLPAELASTIRLDNWLLDYCKREKTHIVPTKKVQQFGPGGLREKAAIEIAMRGLEELGRARLAQDGRRRIIKVNPSLVEGGKA